MTLNRFLLALTAIFIPLALLYSMDHRVRLGERFDESRARSMDQIEHEDWDRLLKGFVNQKGEVDYQSWSESTPGLEFLDRYLNHLSSASLTLPARKTSRLAFWINAYNAVTIKGILREYPTDSIRKHTSNLGGYNIWKHLLLRVGGKEFSLNDIEHQILRKMDEPRIHFAIVCASMSCPRLLNQAYVGENLNRQLDQNAKYFFANRGNLVFIPERNELRISSIMKWFADDFGADQQERLEIISRWIPADVQKAIRQGEVTVRYLEYDWSLNSTRN